MNVKSLVIHGFYLLILFFTWVAVFDAWGGAMMTQVFNGVTGIVVYYQDRAVYVGYSSALGINGEYAYSDKTCTTDLCDSCGAGGGGLVAMTFFAWIPIMFHAVLVVMRMLGKEAKIPKLNLDSDKCTRFEFYITLICLVLFFFAVISWGPCYSDVTDTAGTTVVAQGYGFIIFCFFPCQFIMLGLVFLIKRDPTLHRLSGEAPAKNTNDNAAQPPAGSGGNTGGAIDPTPNPNSQAPQEAAPAYGQYDANAGQTGAVEAQPQDPNAPR